ncbi:MAG: hypothetical protein OEV30_10865 [Ignavibacteria bacterium]|nr:hypothetical protein [Ignavibacteria bacterium]
MEGMKERMTATLFVCAGMFLLAGCADNTIEPEDGAAPGGVTTEAEALEYYATADEFVANADQTFADESLEPTDYGTFGRIGQTVIPVVWGRFVENVSVNATASFEAGDSLATVQVDKEITGTFRILAKYNEDDTTTYLIEKPFTDVSTRNVIFRRVGREVHRFWLNWIPVATSLVDGKTSNPPVDQEIELTELQFTKPNGDTITVTDPTNFYLRYHWRTIRHDHSVTDVPDLRDGDIFTVKATLVSASPDTDLVVLRYGFSRIARRRMPMTFISETQNGDGTFTRVYQQVAEIRHHPGVFHAGVVALTRKTLFDDDPANYSVCWWGVPYRVL